jgi:hypothetical protein
MNMMGEKKAMSNKKLRWTSKTLEATFLISIFTIAILSMSGTPIMTTNNTDVSAVEETEDRCIRWYCPTLTPTTDVICGETVAFTLTITSNALCQDTIGSVKMEWDTDWTGLTTPVVTSTSSGKAWSASLDGNTIKLKADGTDATNELAAGEHVTVTFSATAPTVLDSDCGGYYECYEWDKYGDGEKEFLKVYTSRNWDGNHFYTTCGYPTVCVTCVTCTETVTDCTEIITTETVTDTETVSDCTEIIATETVTDCTATATTTIVTTTTETATDCPEPFCDDLGTTGLSLFGTIKCEGPSVIVGATSDPDLWRAAPAGTQFAMFIDSTAAALLWGICFDGHLYWDVDSSVVDQGTGETSGTGHEVISGGPVVNAPVKWYEGQKLAPVYYKTVSGKANFFSTEGTPGTGDDVQLVDAQLAWSEVGPRKDIFVIELLQEEGSDCAEYVVIGSSYAGRGTLAASVWFKTVVDPNLSAFTAPYYIVQWDDTNANGHPDVPISEGGEDTYTQLYPTP